MANYTAGLDAARQKLDTYFKYQWPNRAGEMTVRFINGNFRAQGWQGRSFERWKPNSRKRTILVNKGSLRRSTGYKPTKYRVAVGTDVPYAKAQNILNQNRSINHLIIFNVTTRKFTTDEILLSNKIDKITATNICL